MSTAEPGEAADPSAERHPRRWRVGAVGAAVLVLVIAAVAAGVVASDDQPSRVETNDAPRSEHGATTTAAPAPTTTSSTVGVVEVTTTTVTPTTAVRAAAPVRTTVPRATTTTSARQPAPAAGLGQVVVLEHPGIYVIDVTTGTPTRVADATPFDVADGKVLTASGTSVFSTALDGSARHEIYRLDGAERIDWFESAPDGTALVRMSTTRRDAQGNVVGSELFAKLVGPTGDVRNPNMSAVAEVEWSGDGSVLVLADYRGVAGVRPTGAPAWGPIAGPESLVKDVRVAHEGTLVTGEFNGHAVKMLDVATAAWRDTPLWRQVTFAPARELIGQPKPPPGWNGRDPLGLARWNGSGESTTPFSSTGAEPVAAPNGQHVVTLEAPLEGPDNGSRFSLRIRDASGSARFTLWSPQRTFGRDNNAYGQGPAVIGPQWSPDGRFLVVGVT